MTSAFIVRKWTLSNIRSLSAGGGQWTEPLFISPGGKTVNLGNVMPNAIEDQNKLNTFRAFVNEVTK